MTFLSDDSAFVYIRELFFVYLFGCFQLLVHIDIKVFRIAGGEVGDHNSRTYLRASLTISWKKKILC